MSLLDPSMNDNVLMSLMHSAWLRSVLLFEDIDSAGIEREINKKVPSNDEAREEKEVSSVTLSGLLNALDGVAVPESYIVILTTNRIEALDEALIRAGRISQKVPFYLAGPEIGLEMFLRFVQEDIAVPGLALTGQVTSAGNMSQQSQLEKEHQILCDLAKEFPGPIPDQKYSPAEIQDYLLMHIDDPEGAVNNFGAWMKYVAAEADPAKERTLQEEAERKRQKLEAKLEEQRKAAEAKILDERLRIEWLVNEEEQKAAAKITAKKARRAKKAAEASKAKGQLTPGDSSTSAGNSDTHAEYGHAEQGWRCRGRAFHRRESFSRHRGTSVLSMGTGLDVSEFDQHE